MQPPQRHGDLHLMEHFLMVTKSTSILRQLNACRLYLQVTLLSEITSPDGLQLERNWYNGELPQLPHSKLLFPIQPKPNKTAWSHWKKSLSTLTSTNSLDLRFKLRQWTKSGPDLSTYWPAVYDSPHNILYIRTPEHCYEIYHPITPKSLRFDTTGQTTDIISRHALPATTINIANHIRIQTTSKCLSSPTNPPTATFDAYV